MTWHGKALFLSCQTRWLFCLFGSVVQFSIRRGSFSCVQCLGLSLSGGSANVVQILEIYSGAQMKCNWENLRYLNNWCCNLNESKCSPKVLSEVVLMRWFTGYKVCMALPWGVYLWICQFWTFSIKFFMEFEVDHLKEPFFLSIIAFCLIKKCGHIHEL